MEDRLITVAIHTYERAVELKTMLENEGVTVSLQNVNLSAPVVASGVRVRIRENDLPLALRLIENAEIFKPEVLKAQDESESRYILVPVDFSSHSLQACDLAFHFAASQKADIILVHTYVDPSVTSALQLSDNLTYEITDTELRDSIEKEAQARMARLSAEIRERIKRGELPPVRFKHEISEGVPEDVINSLAKQKHPLLIVMGTRGADTKERELVGSVTAEVLDTCRYPVFTVPADVAIHDVEDIRNIVFFCTLDQEDILALDQLARLLHKTDVSITLANIPSKKQSGEISAPFNALLHYCQEHYPSYKFDTERLQLKTAEEDFRRITAKKNVNLIVVPNKKKNIFSRLFNPGLAHRLLFRADIPMMVLPV